MSTDEVSESLKDLKVSRRIVSTVPNYLVIHCVCFEQVEEIAAEVTQDKLPELPEDDDDFFDGEGDDAEEEEYNVEALLRAELAGTGSGARKF